MLKKLLDKNSKEILEKYNLNFDELGWAVEHSVLNSLNINFTAQDRYALIGIGAIRGAISRYENLYKNSMATYRDDLFGEAKNIVDFTLDDFSYIKTVANYQNIKDRLAKKIRDEVRLNLERIGVINEIRDINARYIQHDNSTIHRQESTDNAQQISRSGDRREQSDTTRDAISAQGLVGETNYNTSTRADGYIQSRSLDREGISPSGSRLAEQGEQSNNREDKRENNTAIQRDFNTNSNEIRDNRTLDSGIEREIRPDTRAGVSREQETSSTTQKQYEWDDRHNEPYTSDFSSGATIGDRSNIQSTKEIFRDELGMEARINEGSGYILGSSNSITDNANLVLGEQTQHSNIRDNQAITAERIWADTNLTLDLSNFKDDGIATGISQSTMEFDDRIRSSSKGISSTDDTDISQKDKRDIDTNKTEYPTINKNWSDDLLSNSAQKWNPKTIRDSSDGDELNEDHTRSDGDGDRFSHRQGSQARQNQTHSTTQGAMGRRAEFSQERVLRTDSSMDDERLRNSPRGINLEEGVNRLNTSLDITKQGNEPRDGDERSGIYGEKRVVLPATDDSLRYRQDSLFSAIDGEKMVRDSTIDNGEKQSIQSSFNAELHSRDDRYISQDLRTRQTNEQRDNRENGAYQNNSDRNLKEYILDNYSQIGSFEVVSVDYNTMETPITKSARLQSNLEAIETLFALKSAEIDIRQKFNINKLDNRNHIYANKESLEKLSKYTGFGGLSGFFNENNKDFDKERDKFNEIIRKYSHLDNEFNFNSLKTQLELSSDNAYYTPTYIINSINEITKKLGIASNNEEKLEILEPSAGIGRFINNCDLNANFTAYELDKITADILKFIQPNTNVINKNYLSDIKEAKYDLVIGNPPYGANNLTDKFVEKALANTKDGGFVIFVTSSRFLDNCNMEIKKIIDGNDNIDIIDTQEVGFEGIGRFIGALRLPPDVFKDQGVSISTDIVVFQKGYTYETTKDDNGEIKTMKRTPLANKWEQNKDEIYDFKFHIKDLEIMEALKEHYIFYGDKKNEIYLSQIIGVDNLQELKNDNNFKHDIIIKLKKGLNSKNKELYEKFFGYEDINSFDLDYEKLGYFMLYYNEIEKVKFNLYKTNSYFLNNPKNNLTTEAIVNSSRFGYELKIDHKANIEFDQQIISNEIAKFANRLPENIFKYTKIEKNLFELELSNMPTNTQEYYSSLSVNSYVAIEQDIYKIKDKNSDNFTISLEKIETSESEKKFVKSYIKYRDAIMRKIDIDNDFTIDNNDIRISKARDEVHTVAFDLYGKNGKPIKSVKRFSDDPSMGMMLSLIYPEEQPNGTFIFKRSKILDERVITNKNDNTEFVFKNPSEGVLSSISKYGYINVHYLANETGLSIEETRNELYNSNSDIFFTNPDYLTGKTINIEEEFLFREQYLSGNVIKKIEEAQKLIEKYSFLEKNIKELNARKPEALSFDDPITINFGVDFVPIHIYKDFIAQKFKTDPKNVDLKYFEINVGKSEGFGWMLKVNGGRKTYITNRITDVDVLENTMNTKSTRITKDGKIDKEAVMKADIISRDIKREWSDWINNKPEYLNEIYNLYTDRYMCYVDPKYDGSILTFSSQIPLREHQKNAVFRCNMEKNTFLNHQVGSGKTMTAIATAIEGKKLGTIEGKTLIVVKPETQAGWMSEIYKTYPNASVLSSSMVEFKQSDPSEFLRKMANFDGDIVLITHNEFANIERPIEVKIKILQERISAIDSIINEVNIDREREWKPKALPKLQSEYRKEINNLMIEANTDKTLKTKLTIDKLGIGCFVFDEFQEAKNMETFTALKARGIRNSKGSRLGNALLETSYTFNKESCNTKMIMLSGTPISNAPYELYNIMRIMSPETLKETRLNSLDSFMRVYGNIEIDYELSPSGVSMIETTRNKGYTNLIELGNMTKTIFDNITNEDVERAMDGKFVPRANYIPVFLKPTDFQLEVSQNIASTIENLKGGELLAEYTKGRKNGTDPRLISNRSELDEDKTKINSLINNVVTEYENTKEIKGTQLVFMDLGTPQIKSYNILNGVEEILDDKEIENLKKSNAYELGLIKKSIITAKGDKIEAYYSESENTYYKAHIIGSSVEFSELNEDTGLSLMDISNDNSNVNKNIDLYADVYKKLADKGIKPQEIAFIHDANTLAEKKKLFDKVNKGEVRVLLGSYAKMGTGVNVQRKITAMHEVTCPWRPSDIEQAEGRAIRQGNEFFEKDNNFEVKIYRYATEQTTDALMWQANNLKAQAIRQFIQSQTAKSRQLDNAFSDFELNADLMKSQATGNPYMVTFSYLKTAINSIEFAVNNEAHSLFNNNVILNNSNAAILNLENEKSKLEKLDLSKIHLNDRVIINTIDINDSKNTDFKGIEIIDGNKNNDDLEIDKPRDLIRKLNLKVKDIVPARELDLLEYKGFKVSVIYDTLDEKCFKNLNAYPYVYTIKDRNGIEFENNIVFDKYKTSSLGEKNQNSFILNSKLNQFDVGITDKVITQPLTYQQLKNVIEKFINNIEERKITIDKNIVKAKDLIQECEENIKNHQDYNFATLKKALETDFDTIQNAMKNPIDLVREDLLKYRPKSYEFMCSIPDKALEKAIGNKYNELKSHLKNMSEGKEPLKVEFKMDLFEDKVATEPNIQNYNYTNEQHHSNKNILKEESAYKNKNEIKNTEEIDM